MIWRYLCLVALVFASGIAFEEERGKCRTVKDTMMTCLEAGTNDLPKGKMESVNWLVLVRSSVPVIKREMMKVYPALTDLHANNANVETIEEDAFHDLPELNWVELSYNKLSKLDVDLFKEAKTMYYLNISGNPDLIIPANKAFLNSPKLNWLDISYCNIKELYAETFNKLRGLKVLSLAGNRLEALPDGIFHNLQKLYSLDLSNNQFQTLSPNLMRDISHISLYLGRNPWQCDCSLYPFIEWARTQRLKEEVRCAKPDDKLWADVTNVGCKSTMIEAY